MKILLVHNYPLKTGGVSLLNLELAQFLKNKGYEVKIFSPIIEENLDFVENNFENLKNLILESDLVILNPSPYLWPSILRSFFYLQKFNKKFLVWFHLILDSKVYLERYGKEDYFRRLNKLSQILNSENCLEILCVSEAVKNSLKEIVTYKEKLKVIYPGVNVSFKTKKFIRKNLIYAGRFSEEKNLEILIRAFAKVSERIKDIKLTLIGEGSEESKLKDLVQKLKIKDKVYFLPLLPKEKLYPFILQHQFLINPSKIESLSLITLESLILETPVIVSKNAGHLEVTQNGKAGALFDPYNEKDLVEKIIYGLKNYPKVLKKTRKASKILRKTFDYEKNWSKYEEVILNSILRSPILLPQINFALSQVSEL